MRNIGIAITIIFCSSALYALDAGLASRDITPDIAQYKVPMAGYGSRMGRPSTGVNDPLMAKVLYLRDSTKECVLITTDLRSITPELKTKIIEQCNDPNITQSNLLVCASHNHSGPSLYPEAFWQAQFGKYDPTIVEVMGEKIAGTIQSAKENSFTAKIGYGENSIPGFTRNRRWGYDTAAREAASETPQVDDTLRVIRIDSSDGKLQGLLVNFATHPTILGADNFALSAEWPGVLQRSLEEKYPGRVAMFANGAEGDQSPDGAQGKDAFEQVQDFGERLALEVAKLADSITTQPDLEIRYHLHTPDLPEIAFSEGAKSGPFTFLTKKAHEALPPKATVQVIAVGGTALVGLPGEPICEVGRATRSAVCAAGFEHVLIVGLANDYLGYILNAKEYAHGGYEVDARSFYGPLLGDFITWHAGQCAASAASLTTP